MAKWRQGYFTPKHPEKYIGTLPVKFKSGIEQRTMSFMDLNDNVITWSYEPYSISYSKPILKDNQIHMETRQYWIDFVCDIKDKNSGEVKKYMIEVKTRKETEPPQQLKKVTFKNKQRLMNEQLTFAVNKSKWLAADAFCKSKGMIFTILTDDMIN